MKREKKNTIGHSIPLDLIVEILLKLPAKAVLRFRSVSKSWCSIIDSKQFTDAFMSLSLSRAPRLVLAFSDEDRLVFFSSPHQNCSFGSSSSSMLVAEKNNILTVPEFEPCSLLRWYSVRGFTCVGIGDPYMVCNPTTGQVIHLPKNDCFQCSMFLGYDPNRDQYKVLRLVQPTEDSRIEHSVCTLGGGQRSSYSWRPIKTNIHEYTYRQNGVYVDGVVYYESRDIEDRRSAIGCFDVGSEQLRLIETPEDLIQHPECLLGHLTNYLGKLDVYCSLDLDVGFVLWVLDDATNQVWSKKTCIFPSSTFSMLLMYHFSGIIATTGEAVYSPLEVSDSYDLLCYDVEKMMERRVRVEGVSKYHGFYSSLLCSYVDNITYL